MRRFNWNEFFWFVILLWFTCYFLHLFTSGKINGLIHPRMFVYVTFALGVFAILTLLQIPRVFQRREGTFRAGYFLFLIPLVLGFIYDPQEVSSQIAANKGFDFSQYQVQAQAVPDKREQDAVIQITEENFAQSIETVVAEIDSYVGRQIEFFGFVYRDEEFTGTGQERFILGRMLLYCCAADTQIIGLLCDWEEGETLRQDEWVKVRGIIDSTRTGEPDDEMAAEIPLVKVQEAVRIARPQNIYVYP